MKKPFCLFLLFIIFSSPAFAFGTKKTMEKVMNSWSGEDINTAIEVLGYPTSEKEIANSPADKYLGIEDAIVIKRGIAQFKQRKYKVNRQ